MESFTDLVKRARFEELRGQCQQQLNAQWEWPQFMKLLQALGVDQDPTGFLNAGWWLPASARLDQDEVETYATRAEQAIEQGVIPEPESGAAYAWDDVRKLINYCGIALGDVVEGLLWVYAATMGEEAFIESMNAAVAPVPD